MRTYCPEPGELTIHELRTLYRLKRFEEWSAFLNLLYRCQEKTQEKIDNESLQGNQGVIFRHIGAHAFIGELREFVNEAEEYLKTLANET